MSEELKLYKEKYEENRLAMVQKYKELIESVKSQIEKQVGNLESFISSHNEVLKLNDLFRVINKFKVCIPNFFESCIPNCLSILSIYEALRFVLEVNISIINA